MNTESEQTHFVVRLPWNRMTFRDGEGGQAWELLTFLRGLPEASVAGAGVRVVVEQGDFPVHLVALRKSGPAAEVARRRILREAKRKGRAPDRRTLACAGYFFVLTTLPAAVPCEQVLAIHRLLWQIEMAFKRLKCILRFDALRARDPALAQAYLYGKLIGTLLLDELTARAQALSPWGHEVPRLPTELQHVAHTPTAAPGPAGRSGASGRPTPRSVSSRAWPTACTPPTPSSASCT